MAHEVPLQVRPTNNPGAKTNKHKPIHQGKLPNGEKPDFGHGHKEKHQDKPHDKQQQQRKLPNGEKPDFGGEAKESKKNRKPKKGAKKDAGANKNTAGSVSASGKKEGYAGSSFHLSPEAVALPKPSFAVASPKPAGAVPQVSPVQHQPLVPVHPTLVPMPQNGYNFNPAVMYQGMPPVGPPRFPVTYSLAPGGSPPGFNYFAHQGGINYQHPPAGAPHYAMPYPYPPMPQPQQQFGQRITFNDLMGSK